MAHNTSAGRKAAYVRGKTLADYRGFHFIVRCDPCRRTIHIPIATLIDSRHDGGRMKVGEVRLICRVCRRPPTQVSVTNGVQMAVTIWGPGSN